MPGHPDFDSPNTNTSVRVNWDMMCLGGDPTNDSFKDNRRKLNDYVDNYEGFYCPSDTGSTATGQRSAFAIAGNSYYYNSNWYNGPENFWVLYGNRLSDMHDPSLQIMIGDPTYAYAWPYGSWFPLGPHQVWGWSAFHDPPEKHPEAQQGFFEGMFHNVWYYTPKCNVGFLDGHVRYLRIGPYDHPGDYSINTKNYIVDPNR